MKRSVLIFLIYILCQQGCKNSVDITENNNNNNENSSYTAAIPLNVGNYWIYKIKITHNRNSYTYYDTLRVTEYDNFNKFFKLISNNQDVLINGYYNNSNNGFYLGKQLLFKYPGVSGDTSFSKGKIQFIDKDGVYVYCRFKQYNIGAYDDYSVFQEIEYNYLKPNIGLSIIQHGTNTRNNTSIDEIDIRLQSYNLK